MSATSEPVDWQALCPIAEPWQDLCPAQDDDFLCTRAEGHGGNHAAHGSIERVKPVHIWPQHDGTDAS